MSPSTKAIRALCTLWLAVGMFAVTAAPRSWAVEPSEILSNPELEKRARNLSVELRCVVCQNQSIDDSNAPLAKDLRVLVRERLVAGDTDRQVLDYVVARYGEFVLLRPPLGLHTILLWLAPLAVLVSALLFIVIRMRGGAAVSSPAQLTVDERRRLDALLSDEVDQK